MRSLRPITALILLLVACQPAHGPGGSSEAASSATSAGSPWSDLSFPGGGRILFLPSEGPGYPWHGVGVVDEGGIVHYFPRDRQSFPYWDPAAPDRLLMLPFGSDPTTTSLEIVGDSLRPVGSWPTSELSTHPSLDGRALAFTPIDPSGRPRFEIIRLVDRSTGESRTVSTHGLVPFAWTPARELLATPLEGGRLVRWDPRTGDAARFGPRHLSSVAWDPSGRRFAGTIVSSGGESESEVVIGTRSGRVIARVPLGRRFVDMPTWSPDGARIAFIVRGGGRKAHRRSSLHVYDVVLRIDSVVAEPVSHARWASWSPDGEWLLIDNWTRERWLFVAAAGDARFPYPWLGAYPRWCCPSSPPSTTAIPVS